MPKIAEVSTLYLLLIVISSQKCQLAINLWLTVLKFNRPLSPVNNWLRINLTTPIAAHDVNVT